MGLFEITQIIVASLANRRVVSSHIMPSDVWFSPFVDVQWLPAKTKFHGTYSMVFVITKTLL